MVFKLKARLITKMALRPGLCSALTVEVVGMLKAGGVNTVTDFLTTDPEKLSQDFNIPYKNVCSIRKVLLAEHSSLPVSGFSLYQEALSTLSILPTQCDRLDCLLDGGFYTGEMMEIAGSSASGKTKICLQSIASTVTTANQNAVFIDSGGSFDAHALAQLALAHQSKTLEQADIESQIKSMFDRIQVFEATDVFQMFAVFHTIKDGFTNQDPFFQNLKLIVVDSICSVINPIMGGDFAYSQSMVCQIGLRLKEIASRFSVAVMVTNRLVSSFDGVKNKVALGRAWSHMPDTRVLLQRPDVLEQSQAGVRHVTLVKSRRQETPSTCFISLGFEDSGLT